MNETAALNTEVKVNFTIVKFTFGKAKSKVLIPRYSHEKHH